MVAPATSYNDIFSYPYFRIFHRHNRKWREYNGENLVEYEKINNAIVKTDLMPSDSGEALDWFGQWKI